jgi:PAS domain S-box-containing protein
VSASGKTIPAEVHERRIPWGDGQAVLSVSRDITERKRADIRERLAIDILTWLNQPGNTMDTIRDIIQLMQKSTGLEAVGIRLRESDDFPYYEAKGFTDDFLATERNLCERDAVGNIARDAQGNAVLECMCGNVLRGRTDPKFPFFTEAGSFWTNCTTDCMASTMKNESLRRIRNRCNRAGYESVALIPVKSGDEIIGLLQLNDHRRNQFTREIILFFEGLGASIGIAVARKKAREALNESEARFRELFNRMSSGVAVYEAVDNGADFVFRDFNPAAEKIEKISRKDILGRRVSEAFPGVKAFGVFEVFQRVWQTGKPEHFPLNIYKDERDPGSWRENWVFKLPAGEIVAIYNDITERKRTEQAVLDSEVRYHALFENSADGILIADVETKNFLYANLALCQMIGYAEEELKTMSLADIHPKDALPRVVADFESQMRGEKTLAAAIPCLRKDGAIFYADINSTTVALDGRTCLVGFFRDITERKRVEVELRKSEERFRQALENIPDVIVIYDRDLRIKNINAATLRITGRPVSDFIGRREEEIWPPEIYEVYLPTLRKAYETRTICSLETKLSLPGYNPRALCITCVPLLDENGEVREIMGVTHDLTESKQAENKLSEQLDELRRWQTVTSGREDRILKMKKEVNELLERLGEQPRYGSMEEK